MSQEYPEEEDETIELNNLKYTKQTTNESMVAKAE